MRVALIHDYLNQYGGAERVLEVLCEMFPDAPIYTLFYDEEKTLGKFKGKDIRTSFLNCKFVIDHHRLFIPLMPLAAYLMKTDESFDVVVSSTVGFAKGVGTPKNAVHISYLNAFLRYIWSPQKYFYEWSGFKKTLFEPAFWYMRLWDRYSARKPHLLIANSKYTARKAGQYYGRETPVLYPPVDIDIFRKDQKIKNKKYFLAIGRLVAYKRFDLVVRTFNKLDLPLLIVGDGPELEKLKRMSRSEKISFTPFTDKPEELRKLYSGAEALIFPQVEYFGLVAAEAQACGIPVIALNKGGAKEIVKDNETGILFNNQTEEDIIMAVKKLRLREFDPKKIRESALRFSKTKFKKNLLKKIYETRNKLR